MMDQLGFALMNNMTSEDPLGLGELSEAERAELGDDGSEGCSLM